MDFSLIAQRARRLRRLNAFITERFDQFEKEASERLQLYRKRLRDASEDKGNPSAAVAAASLSDRAVFPIAVKDAFSTRDIRTTCASKMLANYTAPFTATVVDRLQQAGGVIIGKTNMDEFSMGTSTSISHFGPSKSPWTFMRRCTEQSGRPIDLDADWLLPGGSSGGSAIAVACGLAKIGLGSDTGGSVRNPAAWCGVVGLKPSYGLLSRFGLVPLVNSLDAPAVLTNTVDDAAWALDLMSGQDRQDPTSVQRSVHSYVDYKRSLRGLVVGIPREYHNDSLHPRVLQCWRRVAGLLAEAGWAVEGFCFTEISYNLQCCIVRRVSMPHTHWSIRCYHVLGECDVASNMARYDGIRYGYRAPGSFASLSAMYAAARSDAFNEVVRRRILAGNYFLLREHYDEFYGQAMRVRRLIAEDHWRLFRTADYELDEEEKVDVLLTPVCSDVAPMHSQFIGSDGGYARERADDFYTQPANMAGVPAVSIPVQRCGDTNLPISLQIVADNFQEHKLLNVAAFIEQSVQFEPLDVDEVMHKMETS